MFDISHITALTSSPTLTTVAKEVSPTSSTSAISKLSSERSADSATLSTLSSQLNGSAMRAQIRDSRLGFKELGAVATSINDKITGTHYYANRALHDAEVPIPTIQRCSKEPGRLRCSRMAGSKPVLRIISGSTQTDHV